MICFWVLLQDWIPEGHVFKRDWIACFKYYNRSKFYSEYNMGDMYGHSIDTRRFFTLISMRYSCEFQKVATTLIWIC